MTTVSQDRTLDEAIAKIANVARPWRVVLFGSRARGDANADSDYDLYVELDVDETQLREIRHRFRLLSFRPLTVDVKVHRRGRIEERRDDPGTIEWDVARDGRVLYADPAAPRSLASRRQVGEPSQDTPQSVHEWLKAATRDANLIAHIRTAPDDFSAAICSLSQQMCEKYMKALLVSRHVRPTRTHELEDLLVALRRAGCPLPGLDKDCELLSTHAVEPRYAEGNDLGNEEAQAVSEAATRVVAAVRAELPPSVH
jgi:HEPN domain-containing protein/predicted nucleotidyltransferase